MKKQILGTFVLGAVVSALVLNGCGTEDASSANPSSSVIASAARNMEQRDYERDDDRDESERSYRSRFMTVMDALRALPALDPLFDRYQVPDPIVYGEDSTGLVALLRAVRISVREGVVTITNRRTGGVIFSARLDALAEGTFYPEQMPGGTGTPPPPPQTCAFDYSEWSACQPDGSQTRTVIASSPDGCTGDPITSRSCSYVPPVSACTSFNYSAWGACQPDGTQSRTVTESSPTGCTGGSPVTSQSCTYVPPVTTCTSFTYSAWGACQSNGTQTRTVISSSPSGCTGGAPVTTQSCTYVPPVTTCSSFTYSAWGTCSASGTQTRTVTASSPSGCTGGTPVLSQSCTPPPVTCTSFTYSAWGTCQSNNTQTRTVTASSPSGCTGGTPVLRQSCTYTPPIDGAALYTQYCSGCHGTSKKGSSVSAIQGAISTNRGGMGSLSFLTTAQIQAISAAP
jgi:hypothetical protein